MRFECTNCKGIVAIDDSECGKPVDCGHCGNIAIVPEDRFSPNAVINYFVIRDVLGRGGMGTVYLAHQLSLDRPVALKILMEQYSEDSEFIVDFVKEARAAVRLNHPNIVQSYAVGEEDGIFFFAMEYVEGRTLKHMLEEQQWLPMAEAVTITRQIAEALDFAWKNQKLVHRDIKPANIILTARGVAKLADLGLARFAHELANEDTNMVMGTPQYISPEQLTGVPMDVRGDIYSLGATLYHAVSGRFPFEGNTPVALGHMPLSEPLVSPKVHVPDLPDTVCWVIAKMMAKQPDDRYSGADVLMRDLDRILAGNAPDGYATATGQPGEAAAATVAAADTTMTSAAEQPGAAKSTIVSGPGCSKNIRVGRKKKVRFRGGTTSMQAPARPTGAGAAAATPAMTAAAAVPAARITAAPPKIASAIWLVPILVVVVVIGVLGVLVYSYVKYHPDSPAGAESLYLSRIPDAERKAYISLKPLLSDTIANNRQNLTTAVNQCQQFLQQYRGSLFSVSADAADFRGLFRLPHFLTNNLRKQSLPLTGIVARKLADHEERLIRVLREAQHEEELREVEERRAAAARKARLDQLQGWLQEAVGQARARIGDVLDRHRMEVETARASFEIQREIFRDKLVKTTAAYDYDGATKYLEKLIRDTSRSNSTRRFESEKILRETFDDHVRQAAQTLRQWAREAEVDEMDLRYRFETMLESSDITALREQLAALDVEEMQLTTKKKQWFESHKTYLQKAREYFQLVGDTQRKHHGTKIKVPVTAEKVHEMKVSHVGRKDLYVEIIVWNHETSTWHVTEIEPVPLPSVPIAEFQRLGEIAWGDGDPDEYLYLLGSFLFYVHKFTFAGDVLIESQNQNASFLLGDLIDVAFGLVRKYAGEGDGGRAKEILRKLKERYGTVPQFQERENDFQKLLE